MAGEIIERKNIDYYIRKNKLIVISVLENQEVVIRSQDVDRTLLQIASEIGLVRRPTPAEKEYWWYVTEATKTPGAKLDLLKEWMMAKAYQ